MSIEFLKSICGNSQLAKEAIIDPYEKAGVEPRIAWYPSAGYDLRPLIYLSDEYAKVYPGESPDIEQPDIFLMTDAAGCGWLDQQYAYFDNRTQIEVLKSEDCGMYEFIWPVARIAWLADNYYKVTFQQLRVKSKKWDHSRVVNLIYVKTENEAFCSEVMIPMRARISHLVHKNYGGGLGGGGSARGAWLPGVLTRLGVEAYITDDRDSMEEGDLLAIQHYGNLRPSFNFPVLELYRVQPGRCWDTNFDIKWFKVNGERHIGLTPNMLRQRGLPI